jgi:hypothetical protein
MGLRHGELPGRRYGGCRKKLRGRLEWILTAQRDTWVAENAIKKGREPPAWYVDEPEIEPVEQFYVDAFNELSSCRTFGMVPGPIPWRDIVQYASFHEIDEDMFPTFLAVIRSMDAAYIRWVADKHDDKAATPRKVEDDGKAKNLGDGEGPKSFRKHWGRRA